MSQFNRLGAGGRINREARLSFVYDGRSYTGYAGDTLASALLANNVHLVGRSFKYHRPRGILGSGAEEPNALVQLESGAYTEPNTRATQVQLYDGLTASSQNCWPNAAFDVNAVNSWVSRFLPAGFYYKTFKWPRSFWLSYERVIRQAAGLGVSPMEVDPDSYEHRYVYCDVLVVGAGPAGLAAATAAARTGARVVLVDEQFECGGSLLGNGEEIDAQPGTEWTAKIVSELAGRENVRILPRTTVTGYYDHNYLIALERITDHLPLKERPTSPRQRLWKLRAKRVVLATGAIERPLVFADNDRPGIMLSNAIGLYVRRYGVLPGRKVVFFTNNDSAYQTALAVAEAGADVVIVDLRSEVAGSQSLMARERGIKIIAGSAITGVGYRFGLRYAEVTALTDDGSDIKGNARRVPCSIIGMSGGWSPTVHLFSQARGKLRFDERNACFVPSEGAKINPNVCVGAANGVFGLSACLAEAHSVARTVCAELGFTASDDAPAPQAMEPDVSPMRVLWCVPCDHPVGQGPKKHYHDFQSDATVADISLAAREGYRSVEHLKRYTATGMGTDQGKTSNVNALAIVSELRGTSITQVGTTTFRPPYVPLTLGGIVGQNCRDLFLPERKTPMHGWHVARGAIFEDVGDWKRARYFPRHSEDMHVAVQRECRAVRDSVGILDATTLGKIDIQGKDSAEFLNRIYTNGWKKLGIGKCRYGLMLNEHGMVFDDGVTTRLGKRHFHMTTTTGGAARVMTWLEKWLQTEWTDLEVFCTSVTEQWSVMAINGPQARSLLSELTPADLSSEAFPFMSMISADIAGVPARIFRISFTGELAFEVNVPASFGQYVWERIAEKGEKYSLCPYGTESMHVLRAEKGFIIVGQDSDGTMTPDDLGMSWIVNRQKPDFLGRRSHFRSDIVRPGRKQLVGLLTVDPWRVLPEGAHVVDDCGNVPPMPMLGHVTSSYMSPNLGRSIAMAVVKDGRHRRGSLVDVALMDGRKIRAKVCDPVFIDHEGGRARA